MSLNHSPDKEYLKLLNCILSDVEYVILNLSRLELSRTWDIHWYKVIFKSQFCFIQNIIQLKFQYSVVVAIFVERWCYRTQFWKRITKRLSQSTIVLFASITSEKIFTGVFSKVTLLYKNQLNNTFYRKSQKISWTTHCHADAI